MADAPAGSRAGTPTPAPLKIQLDDHAPSISSPLNPDAAARLKQAPTREKREKKDSLKKREAAGQLKPSSAEGSSKKRKVSDQSPAQPSPVRYNHPLPKEAFHYTVKEPTFASREGGPPFVAPSGVELKHSLDQQVLSFRLLCSSNRS